MRLASFIPFAIAILAALLTAAPPVSGTQNPVRPANPGQIAADTGIVRSARLAGGLPLGGIGCGTFELMTDGSISRATINNNWDQPTGDLKGCFAAVWTRGGGRVVAKTLQLKNPYGLPSSEPVQFRGQFPQAFIEYPDRELPVKVSLRAFSPLIPHDVKNSSIPAALFIFRVTNQARGPVEASVALSWENFLGVGGTATEGPFSDRTGNSIAKEPAVEGHFGLRMSTRLTTLRPESRLRYNATGNYALLAEATAPETTVTSAGWNAADSVPGWWGRFAESGAVDGEVGPGVEGSVHPAGVVALKISLKDGETREVPFVVAWYTQRHWTTTAVEYGHQYERSFEDSVGVARYALQNRLALGALTDEWQGALLRSTLPGWLCRRLMDDSSSLFTNTILTRDSGLAGTAPGPGLFNILESPVDGKGALGAMDHLHLASALHANFFPQLHLQVLGAFRAAQSPAGEIPRIVGHVEHELVPGKEGQTAAESERRPDVQCAYAYLVYRYFRTAGDQKFLDDFYPSVKHAIQFAASLDPNGDGIPEGQNVYGTSGSGFDSYSALLWLGTLKIGQSMAGVMQDKRFSDELAAYTQKAQPTVQGKLWGGRNFRLRPDSQMSVATQLAGVWLADSLGLASPIPADQVSKSIESLLELNDRKGSLASLLLAPPGEDRRSLPAHSAVFQAAVYARHGKASDGLALMQRLNRVIADSGLKWQAPLSYNADTGAPQGGRSHISNAASWHYYQALLGFDVDLSEGVLTLVPRLPISLKTLSTPIFSPTFVAWMDYRPAPRRTLISFRLDRYIPVAKSPVKLQAGTGLTLKKVVIPSHGTGTPEVFASVGRAPVPGKLEKGPDGRLIFTFETPVKLTAGHRLEFILR